MGQSAISLNCGAKYKNYPFYDWMPKPLGIILLILLFIPILTVGGVYTANSGEMMSGTHTVRRFRHIDRHGSLLTFLLSTGVHTPREDNVRHRILRDVYSQLRMRRDRQHIRAGPVQPCDGFSTHGAHDGESVHAHTLRFRNGGHAEHNARQRADRRRRMGPSGL